MLIPQFRVAVPMLFLQGTMHFPVLPVYLPLGHPIRPLSSECLMRLPALGFHVVMQNPLSRFQILMQFLMRVVLRRVPIAAVIASAPILTPVGVSV
jgi:hypothetical protein